MNQLTAHFTRAEFTCHCGCGASNINMKLVELLEQIRTSGFAKSRWDQVSEADPLIMKGAYQRG